MIFSINLNWLCGTGGLATAIWDAFTKKMPEKIKVDIGINDSFGGHTSYFNNGLYNTNGVNNITTITDAIWDKIK